MHWYKMVDSYIGSNLEQSAKLLYHNDVAEVIGALRKHAVA